MTAGAFVAMAISCRRSVGDGLSSGSSQVWRSSQWGHSVSWAGLRHQHALQGRQLSARGDLYRHRLRHCRSAPHWPGPTRLRRADNGEHRRWHHSPSNAGSGAHRPLVAGGCHRGGRPIRQRRPRSLQPRAPVSMRQPDGSRLRPRVHASVQSHTSELKTPSVRSRERSPIARWPSSCCASARIGPAVSSIRPAMLLYRSTSAETSRVGTAPRKRRSAGRSQKQWADLRS